MSDTRDPATADEHTGPYGTAQRVPRTNFPGTHPGVDAWVITAPRWHPVWSQYGLCMVGLADMPGVPPAHRQFPEATHELIVFALNPDHGPYCAADVRPGTMHHLEPVNVVEQFTTTTDDKARELAALCARAVVDGVLIPETADAPDRIRAAWRRSIRLTLEHDRDPHHGHPTGEPK